ncbi:hypothetical protein FQN57_004362 [Myotisia sp. PD_48]|nr:hypothetical protein FQN57_004362 [Myotisia sp. PD_48]
MLIPYDNALRLAIRFNLGVWFRKAHVLQTPFTTDRWLLQPPPFPINLAEDVGIILKSGFGTQERIPAWLASQQGSNLTDLLIIGDFATRPGEHYDYHGRQLPVHDIVEWMLKKISILSSDPSHPRLLKYSKLAAAIASGDTNLALNLSKSFGWELDCMKFISGLELAYHQLPAKKWYILVDDDTFIVPSSIKALLGNLEHKTNYYIGNPVGDYKGRFAHGGSSVILSQASMHRLLGQPKIVAAAHVQSLEQIWGDKLLATTLMQVGIYLDERYSHLFNGESPEISKLTEDRFCAPIVSFHKLSPSDLLSVGEKYTNSVKPVRWTKLWGIDQALSTETVKYSWDYVGRLDEETLTVQNIATAEECVQVCYSHSSMCLAWTWESKKKACHISPWIIPGDKADGKVSGLNIPRVKRLSSRCKQ